MATFIDSHAHLADPAFAGDVDDVIARASAAGARGIVCIGESLDAADRARLLARRYPGFVHHTAGVHPHDASGFDAARDIPRIRQHLAGGAVAIGECGLDFHYDNSPRTAQQLAFSAQLELATETGATVVVHTRDAEELTTGLVVDAARGGVRGVLHCYTGSATLARTALDVGWYVSFSGIVTFRSWTDTDLLRLIPDDRLLVESDSPYLAPVPNRGRRNEPAWVSHTIAHLAGVRGHSAAALAELTAANAERCFGLATRPAE